MNFKELKKLFCKVSCLNLCSFWIMLSFILYSLPIFSQDRIIMDSLAKQLHVQAEKKSKLSVYLQTSKGIYETGEDLWFKGYVLDAKSLNPSSLDNTLYLQLETENNNQVVLQEKYQIKKGFVNGHIYIHDSLQAGNYRLMAYTSHSFNNGIKEFHALRKLKIAERISEKSKEDIFFKKDTVIKKDSIHFSLFPEGGHLVTGILSTVGFKAVNSKGLPKDVFGTLYENDKPILTFKSIHAGMGSFMFIPNINSNYHFRLNDSLFQEKIEFPKIKSTGKAIQLIENTKDTLSFKVSQSPSLKKEIIYLRVQIRGVVYSIAKATLDKQITVKIPIKEFPQGIAEITLFNQNLMPVAERLVYVKQDQKLYIKTILDKKRYFTKQKASLKLKVLDQNNVPVVAHLGLSVYDQIYKNQEDCKTIESHFQLSTQLKGNLYNPSYYFNKKNEDRKQALNFLMLTQGWRCYVWNEQNLRNQKKVDSLYIKDHIKGELIYGKKGKNTIQQSMVGVFNPKKEDKKNLMMLDSLNNFYLTKDYLKMGKSLYIKHYGRDRDRIKIIIEEPFKAINKIKATKKHYYPFTNNTKKIIYNKSYFNTHDPITLNEVELKVKKKHVFRDKYLGKLDSLAKLEMNTDYVCKLDNYLNCLFHPKNKKNSKKPIEGGLYQELVVLKNGTWVKATHPGDFEEATFYNNPYLPRYHVPELTEDFLMKKYHLIRTDGYCSEKEFYNPIYDNETIDDSFPDYRNTLFWKSDIITNEKGEANIEFYTSDINTKFIGMIEGVSGNGLLGTNSFHFYVAKQNE